MGSDFNWGTEEGNWESTPAAAAPPGRRRWLWLPILAVTLGLAGYVVNRQLNQRADVVTESVGEDVIANHLLLQNLSGPENMDLLISFLSGSEPEWAAANEQLLLTGALFDRPALGLFAAAPIAAEDIGDVAVSPDLLRAEIVTERPYAVHVGNGISQTVTFSQTAVYRLGPNRWLFAPPEPDFWGETRRSETAFLRLSYPARDADLVDRIAAELDGHVARLCATPELHCPPGFHVQVDLVPDPAALLPVDPVGYEVQARENHVDLAPLPAPSLVGRPGDGAAFDALVRGYATHVVAATANHLLAWDCCARGLLYGAVLDRTLAEAGVKAWPLAPADYDELVRDGVSLDDSQELLNRNGRTATRRQAILVRALVAFLLEDVTRQSPLELSQRLLTADPLRIWPEMLARRRPDVAEGELGQRWRRFILARSHMGQSPPPAPFPDQPLMLACQPANLTPDYGLYRYEPGPATWSEARRLPLNYVNLHAVPGADGLIISQAPDARFLLMSSLLWRGGAERLLLNSGPSNLRSIFPVQGGAHDGPLVFATDDVTTPSPLKWLDMAACSATSCPLRALQGPTVWSPSGARTLIVIDETPDAERPLGVGGLSAMPVADIWLGDAAGRPLTVLGEGLGPFWINETRAGWLGIDEAGRGVVVEVVLSPGDAVASPADAPDIVLTTDEIAAVAATAGVSETLVLESVLSPPGDNRSLFLLAGAAPTLQAPHVLWQFNRTTGDLYPRLTFTSRPWLDAFSPDGRWLVVVDGLMTGQADARGTAHLIDTRRDENRTYVVDVDPRSAIFWHAPWSADANWTVLVIGGIPYLVYPAGDYVRPILPESDLACPTVAWQTGE